MSEFNFVPRTTAPTVANKYYRHTGYYYDGVEGVNEAIVIDNQTGFVMPNCVGYTWGRIYEAYGTRPNCNPLLNGDEWWGNTSDGYLRGQSARLGSVICFSGGLISGHVAFVEEILSNGNLHTSNSAYGGTLFWTETVTYDSATQTYTRPYSGYTCQGFIYVGTSGGLPVWLLKKIADNRRW